MEQPEAVETLPDEAAPKPRRRATKAATPRKQRIFPKLDKRPYKVGEPLPNMLSVNELMRALNMNAATFDQMQREGKLRRFEHKNPIQRKRRYSGALVTKYLNEAK